MNVAFDITCPRCGDEVEVMRNADPRGWASRERRLVLKCTKGRCGWGGVVIAELVDITHHRSVA